MSDSEQSAKRDEDDEATSSSHYSDDDTSSSDDESGWDSEPDADIPELQAHLQTKPKPHKSLIREEIAKLKLTKLPKNASRT